MEKLYVMSLLLLNFYVLNVLISFIAFFLVIIGRRYLLSTLSKGRLLFIALVSPPLLSAFIIITSFMPPVFTLEKGSMLCLNTPYCYIFPFIPQRTPMFHGILFLVSTHVLLPFIYAISGLGPYLIERARILRGYNDQSCLTEDLKKFTITHNMKIHIVNTSFAFSFVLGYFSRILVISSSVLKSLSPGELRGLLAHELSHYRRKDNLMKLILQQCRNLLYLFPHVHYLYREWEKTIELIGDEMAAESTRRPLEVASALVKISMLTSREEGSLDNLHATCFMGSNKKGFLTQRVERLISMNDSRVEVSEKRYLLIPSESGFILSLISIFPVIFLAIFEINPFLVHCNLEKLISLM